MAPKSFAGSAFQISASSSFARTRSRLFSAPVLVSAAWLLATNPSRRHQLRNFDRLARVRLACTGPALAASRVSCRAMLRLSVASIRRPCSGTRFFSRCRSFSLYVDARTFFRCHPRYCLAHVSNVSLARFRASALTPAGSCTSRTLACRSAALGVRAKHASGRPTSPSSFTISNSRPGTPCLRNTRPYGRATPGPGRTRKKPRETAKIFHQVPLPSHLLWDLVQALRSMAH